jgi:hypothetical protein
METRNVLRNVFAPLLAAAILLAASPVFAQAQQRPVAAEAEAVALPVNTCPAPLNLTLNANTPNVFTGDFAAGQLSSYQTALNYPGTDKHYLHTFQWKNEHRCCQITRAVLTVKMKANQGGSVNGSDAGNDDIVVMHLGAVVQPYSERIYTHPPVNFPFNTGQTATKTWNLTGAALANINANNRLSFDVEDDTMVQSATLQLSGCCLTN